MKHVQNRKPFIFTPDRRNRKRSQQSTNADKKIAKTAFSIAMAIENSVFNDFFYLRPSIVLTFRIAAYLV